jgi:hypothetical protein
MATPNVNRQVSFSLKPLIPLVSLTTLHSITLSICTAYAIKIPGAIQLLWPFGFSLMLTWWVCADSRSREFSLPYEFGTFVFFAWPVVVPYYTYRCCGWNGLLLGVGICLLNVVPYVASAIVFIYKFMK